jgi:hypothetical protein
MAKDPLYYNLIDACQQEGCPVCRVVLGWVDRYINAIFYENVNDIPTRAHLRKSLGFCSKHAWRLLDGEGGNALGIAIIYQDVLVNVLRALPESDSSELTGLRKMLGSTARQSTEKIKRVLKALLPQKECPACLQQEQANRLTGLILLEYLQDEKMLAALTSSQGLCLPHLHHSLQLVRDNESALILLKVNREKLSSLHGELGEFIRKNDYRFKEESFGQEAKSWRKAISKTMGERGY